MKILFAPLAPFVFHPARIASVALLFVVVGIALTIWRKKIFWTPFAAGAAWAVFAVWEQHCVKMRYNIRVDLAVVYPVIAAFTIFGAVRIVGAVSPQTIPRQFSTRALLLWTTLVAIALGSIVWLVR